MEASLSAETVLEEVKAKKKPGPAPKAKGPTAKEFKELEDKLAVLTEAFIKIATLTGSGNILPEFGYTMWQPSKKDMNRYEG